MIVHPHMFLATREARAMLKSDVTRSDFVWQTANLAGFICGCYTNDLDMIRDSFKDVVIEPQRQALIPGFKDVQRGAMAAGALGCSISGAGPTIFAWAEVEHTEAVRAAMISAFSNHALKSDSWISGIDNPGARVVSGDGRASLPELARRRASRSRSARRSARGWRPTADCTCRRGCPRSMSQRSPARRACPTSRRARSTGSSRAIDWRRSLAEIARAAFDFPAPTTAVEKCQDPLFVLELFHGPTAAFKDFGARFLAEPLERAQRRPSRR